MDTRELIAQAFLGPITTDFFREHLKLVKRLEVDAGHAEYCFRCHYHKKHDQLSEIEVESWSSARYCAACDSVTVIHWTDRMSGTSIDTVLIYDCIGIENIFSLKIGDDFLAFLDDVPHQCEHDDAGEWLHFNDNGEYFKDSEVPDYKTKYLAWLSFMKTNKINGGCTSCSKCGKPYTPDFFNMP